MIGLKDKNQGFSSVYKILTDQKIYKIYNQVAFSKYFRDNLLKFKRLYDELYKLKLSVKHKVISKSIIEIEELESDQKVTIKKLFNNERLLKSFLKQIKNIGNVKKNISSKKIIHEIENYTKNDSQHQKINNKINELKKYIDVYLQNKICHGDLHLGNIFLNRNKFYFLDWDYYVLSSSGYDLAMFAYLEKLNKKQIEKISLYSKVSLEEIYHYLPICQLLDYLYLSLGHQKNGERARKLKLIVDKFILDNL
jgi:thiamine kinase-like enzyme